VGLVLLALLPFAGWSSIAWGAGAAADLEGAEAGKEPRAAILIDDLGQDLEAARRFLALELPLGFSVLPFLPHSKEVAREAAARGREVILHLPLEPWDGEHKKAGPGALFLVQGESEWRRRFREALDAVPGSVGVSSHMGSRFTEREDAMEVVLRELRGRGLFFVDSLTSPRSVGHRAARRLGVRSARRTVFLDHERREEAVAVQIERLIEGARRWGRAVGIGHPRPETLHALRRAIPRLRAAGVRIVPPSEVAE
jgi:hypothetical protein